MQELELPDKLTKQHSWPATPRDIGYLQFFTLDSIFAIDAH